MSTRCIRAASSRIARYGVWLLLQIGAVLATGNTVMAENAGPFHVCLLRAARLSKRIRRRR